MGSLAGGTSSDESMYTPALSEGAGNECKAAVGLVGLRTWDVVVVVCGAEAVFGAEETGAEGEEEGAVADNEGLVADGPLLLDFVLAFLLSISEEPCGMVFAFEDDEGSSEGDDTLARFALFASFFLALDDEVDVEFVAVDTLLPLEELLLTEDEDAESELNFPTRVSGSTAFLGDFEVQEVLGFDWRRCTSGTESVVEAAAVAEKPDGSGLVLGFLSTLFPTEVADDDEVLLADDF